MTVARTQARDWPGGRPMTQFGGAARPDAANCPVIGFGDLGDDTVVVTDGDLARRALGDGLLWVAEPVGDQSSRRRRCPTFLDPDLPGMDRPFRSVANVAAPDHRRARSALTDLLGQRHEHFAPRTLVGGVARRFSEGSHEGEINLTASVVRPALAEFVCRWLGLPGELAPELGDLSRDISRTFEPVSSPGQLRRAALAIQRARALLADVELTPWAEGLDEELATDSLVFLALAAFETASTSVGIALARMQARPGVRPISPPTPRLAHAMIAARPPLAYARRICAAEGHELGPVALRCGAHVYVDLAPTGGEDADASWRSLPFGGGEHRCLGAPYAGAVLAGILDGLGVHRWDEAAWGRLEVRFARRLVLLSNDCLYRPGEES